MAQEQPNHSHIHQCVPPFRFGLNSFPLKWSSSSSALCMEANNKPKPIKKDENEIHLKTLYFHIFITTQICLLCTFIIWPMPMLGLVWCIIQPNGNENLIAIALIFTFTSYFSNFNFNGIQRRVLLNKMKCLNSIWVFLFLHFFFFWFWIYYLTNIPIFFLYL